MKVLKTIVLCFLIGSSFSAEAQQKFVDNDLESVASFGKSMAIGLSVNQDNRVFIGFPNHDGIGSLTLAEEKDGRIFPYPNISWNTRGEYKTHFLRVQDVYVDALDFLWVLDSKPAAKGSIFGDDGTAKQGQFKLVKINTKTDQVDKVYLFEDLDKTTSGLNDVRVDTDKNLAYLSDPGQAAIVVLDLASGKTRSVLAGSRYTTADDLVIEYDGVKMQNKGGVPFSSNVNGIALTKDNKFLYFKPINALHLYRIPTAYLADETLSDRELSKAVEDMGEVGITHGLVADDAGNIMLTTSVDYSIKYLTKNGELKTLVKDSRIIWPDSLGTGSDGYLYFTCAQLQRLPQWNNGTDRTEYPYQMYRVKLP